MFYLSGMNAKKLVVLPLALFVVLAGAADAREPDSAIAARCWRACAACSARAKSDRDRLEACFDVSAACCAAAGREPVYRRCGCH